MANVPMVKQVAWISLVPQLLLMGILIYIFYLLNFANPFVYGALMYLVLSLDCEGQ